MRYIQVLSLCLLAAQLFAKTPSEILPVEHLLATRIEEGPVANAAFYPASDAKPAPPFAGSLAIQQTELHFRPALDPPLRQGRDARLFPGVTLEFFTLDGDLVPVQLGDMVREPRGAGKSSYWRVIPQIGRVWQEAADHGWSRAAFPIMLVSDLENQAQQGLATFLYRDRQVSALTLQFVQQSAPYLLRHFIAWGRAPVTLEPGDAAQLETRRQAARAELAERLPAKPWGDLTNASPAGALAGFGGPLYPKWRVEAALLKEGTLYYEDSQTPFGPYPYPLEMRFGVRSVTKSVGAPLALLHLAQLYGPWVLNLTIGDYVAGLDPKWRRVRFVDAANMATGFGGLGSLKTDPNDIMDGYLLGNYDAWYLAPSREEKLKRINEDLKPYPWEPGTVVRYRDHDFFLLGMALDAYLKSVRGPSADIWDMVKSEVLAPIGVRHAPALRTDEAGGRDGYILFNAGYYPTLDDLAKIARLYQDLGAHNGVQLLNRELTERLLSGQDALRKDGDASVHGATPAEAPGAAFYHLGVHFVPYETLDKRHVLLPTMEGAGENEVVLYPNGMVSLIMANALQVPDGEHAKSDAGPETARAVERLRPFERTRVAR